MTSRQVRGDWCNSTVIDSHSPDLVTIRIPVNSDTIAQMDSGQCAGQVSRRKQMCVWGGGVRVGVGVGVWARVRLCTLCLFQNVSDPLAGKHTMLHLEVTNLAISIVLSLLETAHTSGGDPAIVSKVRTWSVISSFAEGHLVVVRSRSMCNNL